MLTSEDIGPLAIAFFIVALPGAAIYKNLPPSAEKVEAKQEERLSQAQEAFRQNGFSIFGATHRDSNVGSHARDCFTLQKQPDNGSLYQACIYYKPKGYTIGEIRSI